MKIKLTIKNEAASAQRVGLLSPFFRSNDNLGLPNFVTVQTDNPNYSYGMLLTHMAAIPPYISVLSTTNNRAVDFMQFDKDGMFGNVEPYLSKDGHPRYVDINSPDIMQKTPHPEHYTPWHPDLWNIADTHESILWHTHILRATIPPNDSFEIELEITKHLPLEQEVSYAVYNPTTNKYIGLLKTLEGQAYETTLENAAITHQKQEAINLAYRFKVFYSHCRDLSKGLELHTVHSIKVNW